MNQPSVAVLAFGMLPACVSLDIDASVLPACVAQEVSDPAEESSAVLQLLLDEPPYELCSAVAIAPTLLLTAVNCVTPLLSLDDDAGFIPPQCRPSGDAIEDGRFLFRYAPMTAEVGSIDLAGEDGLPLENGVGRVFVSSAASTCMPDVAIVETLLALDLPGVPIRLDRPENPGDDVVIIGFDLMDGELARRSSTATIFEVSSDDGSPTLPPRSIALSGESCAKPGSAVFDADTGALVGLVQTTERTINCSDSLVSPIAVRLAPYRQFVLEVARSVQTSLNVEFGSDPMGLMPACQGM